MALFHRFVSQQERRSFNGSAYMEFQFCKLSARTPMKQIVSTGSIEHWQLDSLYVADSDMNLFYSQYSQIFDDGICNNLQRGPVDMWGINYYAPSKIDAILDRLTQVKPADYESLSAWLVQAKGFNGFYILGI